jgi:ATP-dependent DNA helicase RecQ
MLALCEQVHCRRQALLGYFGDELKQGCNNCDTCLEPVASYDGTLVAQQALSCIYRTGQRFGVHYLIDVLRGKLNDRITQAGHDKQSTFAIGINTSEEQWHSVFRQLVALGLVNVNFEQYGALQLTESCRPILRGEQILLLRKDISFKTRKDSSTKLKTSNKQHDNETLWNLLRAKRTELANAQNVPPYIIFNDATLMAMMEYKPSSLIELAQLSGVGERKLELYGDAFLKVITDYQKINNVDVSDTIMDSINLFQQGLSMAEIANQRQLKEATIYNHLAEGISLGLLELEAVIDLPDSDTQAIKDSFLNAAEHEWHTLKPFYELFNAQFSYEVLRCVRADLLREIAGVQ